MDGLAAAGKELDKLSLWSLRDAFDRYQAGWSKKLAAEVAFALAVAIKRASDAMGEGFKDKKAEYTAIARKYAQACSMRMAELPAETLEDISNTYPTLAGIACPNYFSSEYLLSPVLVHNPECDRHPDDDPKRLGYGFGCPNTIIVPRFPEYVALLK